MVPWLHFTTGLIAGCWIGAVIGGVIVLLFAGKRVRQLETSNMLLRVKLRAKEKQRQHSPAASGGSGPILVVPPRDTNRPASAPLYRRASGDR